MGKFSPLWNISASSKDAFANDGKRSRLHPPTIPSIIFDICSGK
jgi:hypothetical protein